MKPKHKRLITIALLFLALCAGVALILSAFKDNLVFFYSPTQVVELIDKNDVAKLDKKSRVGGMIKKNSFKKSSDLQYKFTLTDFENDITVKYKGVLPPMFREGQGMVAEGRFTKLPKKSSKTTPIIFTATTLMTKHDENYMPPEVKKALGDKYKHYEDKNNKNKPYQSDKK